MALLMNVNLKNDPFSMPWEIVEARTSRQYRSAMRLFAEYAASLDFDLQFQRFDDELKQLPEMYGPPRGLLLLVKDRGRYIGAVGLRNIENPHTCEVKRMYLRPAYRGRGIGAVLLQSLLAGAKQMGYSTVKLDTIGYKMPSAVRLYTAFGFEPTAPYNYNPYEGVLYFEKKL
jgi:GNAT superfamily N-acetyltransferase